MDTCEYLFRGSFVAFIKWLVTDTNFDHRRCVIAFLFVSYVGDGADVAPVAAVLVWLCIGTAKLTFDYHIAVKHAVALTAPLANATVSDFRETKKCVLFL